MNTSIWRETTETRDGNTLSVFFNKSINLLIVDVVHRNEFGGNEVVRIKLDEHKLLLHCQASRKRKFRKTRKEKQ